MRGQGEVRNCHGGLTKIADDVRVQIPIESIHPDRDFPQGLIAQVWPLLSRGGLGGFSIHRGSVARISLASYNQPGYKDWRQKKRGATT